MKRSTFITLIFTLTVFQSFSQVFQAQSPSQRIKLQLRIDQNISWSATLDGNMVIENAVIGMNFTTEPDFGKNSQVKSHTIQQVSSVVHPVVAHKNAEIKDEYEQLSIAFKKKYKLVFRIYDDGLAYQFVDEGKKERNVKSELLTVSFPAGTKSLFPQEESMYSHNERLYLNKNVSDITEADFCSLPVVFISDEAKVVFTETALHNYPGMFLRGNASNSLSAIFPNYVLETKPYEGRSDRVQVITKEAGYIAKTSGDRSYPWRVFVISNDDRKLVESNLTFQLAKPNSIENTEWIKPGKVAWDWYNANNIFGVDFRSGLNTATYKYYIDFAAANGIEYVILDEGWTKSTTEILDFNPEMDVKELISYGNEKGVGIILWVLWKPLDENLDEILETYKSWGAVGIKVDFMQRNDQYMVNSYEQIAKKCAELEMLVDYHGAFKPSGLRRTYPNVVNYEGLKGNENHKWSDVITPEHNVTLPYTRMVAGPIDYTPGSMLNRNKDNFSVSFERPVSMGTRAHQVAMYVVFEAPLQMLCESPSIYLKEQETVDFITQIPTTWDETKVLHGEIGNYIVLARRKGDNWYIGAMTDWDARNFEIDLSFLQEGAHQMRIFKDGVNADRYAEDYKRLDVEVNRDSKISIELASGGGWAAIISKKQ